ncbi:MAG: dimethylsulfonioproprionate lyase family protein [Alphaproteobacteria bacterium]|nr:dimethylsulfonioproprionate lyase family protein [Alphaproteobacteria bacterium]
MPGMNPRAPITRDGADAAAAALYRAVCGLLRRLLPAARRDWLALLPDAPALRRTAPATLPVLGWLPQARACATPETQALVDAVADMAGALPWGQNYSAADFGAAFQARYGFMELIGPRGPFAAADIACGLLLFAPETEYPQHRHEAEEIYVVLAGAAEWRAGAADYAVAPPGAVLHRPSWIPHATRIGAEPMLALYLWRGGDLMQKSEIG